MDKPSTSSGISRFSRTKPLTEKPMYEISILPDSESEIEDNDDDKTFASSSISATSESEDSDSESMNDENPVQNVVQNNQYVWKEVSRDGKKQFPFIGNPKITVPPKPVHMYTPLECFLLVVDTVVINLMVTETNRNARQVLNNLHVSRHSRLSKWKDTDSNEMKKFLGLLLWMGLKRLPSIPDYWSKKCVYKNNVANSIMSRNRFELLLRFWHLSDNLQNTAGAILHKIRNLLDLLNTNFTQFKEPDEYIAVDETMIPFRGRLAFRQYIPGKRHNYGVKLFKVCDKDAYTYKIEIYEGKSVNNAKDISKAIVLRLCENYLNIGRTIVTDNYYSSIELAEELLANNTDFIGTIRKNRKGLPRDVITTKLKKGEIVGKENAKGVTVFKWKDQREVYGITTYHNLESTLTGKKIEKKKTS